MNSTPNKPHRSQPCTTNLLSTSTCEEKQCCEPDGAANRQHSQQHHRQLQRQDKQADKRERTHKGTYHDNDFNKVND
ncbi:hypothetical protein HPB50_009229 [Hyalomma asiaticum]|uniref:Uncharacterized protein n=1 Tax=Hyalomma asiaticum TaxID=266040 RepID=A0ACB7T963_HYAAI|nr:hypothetical protein HPB50_009229 [Hyalomma asiaticum]